MHWNISVVLSAIDRNVQTLVAGSLPFRLFSTSLCHFCNGHSQPTLLCRYSPDEWSEGILTDHDIIFIDAEGQGFCY
jgi:hypothetical protein